MSSRACATLLLVLLALAIPFAGSAWAQGAGGSGGVVITSSPSGAIVELRGEQVFSGVTPWRLNRGLSGAYTIHAANPGYANWEGSTVLSASRQDSVFIRMSRRSPMSTGLRSAVLPGWGQFHAGQNMKGSLFLLAEVGAVVGALYADSKREDAMRVHEAATRAYAAADQVDELELAYEDVRSAFDELERWHEVRKRWVYAAGAVWLANVLDATLFIPSEGGGLFAGLPNAEGAGLFAGVDADRTVLGFSVAF